MVCFYMVAPQGVEPRYSAPEALVLPLNEGATSEDFLVAVLVKQIGREPIAQNQPSHHKGNRRSGQTGEVPLNFLLLIRPVSANHIAQDIVQKGTLVR